MRNIPAASTNPVPESSPSSPRFNLQRRKINIDEERLREILWRGKIGPAFWTVTGAISLVVNVILLAVLLALGLQLFTIKGLVGGQVLGGLHSNFVKMDEANIKTTITVRDTITVEDTIMVNDTIVVQDSIPVKFDLDLKQDTQVVLVKDTQVSDTIIYLNNTALRVPIVLPAGTPLLISLDLTVPVDKMVPVTLNVPVNLKVPVTLDVPVNLQVPVDIPLDQTELHEPFVGLQEVVSPYLGILDELPNTWNETPICGPLSRWFCDWYLNP